MQYPDKYFNFSGMNIGVKLLDKSVRLYVKWSVFQRCWSFESLMQYGRHHLLQHLVHGDSTNWENKAFLRLPSRLALLASTRCHSCMSAASFQRNHTKAKEAEGPGLPLPICRERTILC